MIIVTFLTLSTEHLINSLSEFDITYPTELDDRGRFKDHVTTLSNHRRRRRSTSEETGPITYQVSYKGKTVKLFLRLNTKLFGSDFVVERHKEDGSIETKTVTDQCYLVGEAESFHTSVAISDCDGLAGIIELGNDTIFIEPVLNTSLLAQRGWTRPGRPHLMYSKEMLGRNQLHDLSFDRFDDGYLRRGLKVEKKLIDTAAASQSSYITLMNLARRAVKIYYINYGKELLFRILQDGQSQDVDTFTVHKWIAKDYDTGKPLFINRKKTFIPPTGTTMRNRYRAKITVPPGLKLPPATLPSQPNSHLTFINRSNRFVKVFYVEEGETLFFLSLSPKEDVVVNTYTSHTWFVKDLDTNKILLVNGHKKYIPVKTDPENPIRVFITVPSTLSLPDMIFPDMLKTRPKYIEVMATADSSVVKFHGKEKSEKYILTLMNIVSRLFQHQSIGAPVYFVVVKLVLLEKDPKEIKINGKPMDSLSSVCYWGYKTRKGYDKVTKDYYDQTVFLTRKDFGPSGYAPVHGMCYRLRSCTLNEEDGFASAFIIAHETGHTLGMEHDGVNNNCSNDVIKGSIMAPLVRSRFDRFYWSSCSRRDLLSKLNALWCLDDVPFRNELPYLKKLPGQIYTIDQQCQHDFGRNSRFCSRMKRDPCAELWCVRGSFSGYNDRFCQTRREPALEGTKCGENKWCRLGKCVSVDDRDTTIPLPRPTIKPVHGGWSRWSDLSECSRSCGVGVQFKTRKCNNPVPKHNGRPCEGENIKFELCNTMDCPGKLLTFEETRKEQCIRRAPLKSPTTAAVWSSYDLYSANIDCDFEKGLCGWTNNPSDDFDWRRRSGRTPTAGTGPSFDHTKGRRGHYVYLETSRPVQPGWKARLVSKYIGMRVACLKFWYHAWGGDIHMGELQLIIKTDTDEKVVWSVNKNRGNRWVFHKPTTIFSNKPYRIVFQGIRGDGYLSDFALDDITLENNPCGLGLMRFMTVNNQIPVDPCHQFCEANNDGQSVDVVNVEVENGTACYDNLKSFDVCIQGKCQKIGCDGVIGSNKTLDSCGVCEGNNDMCSATAGTITTLPKEDLETLLECPVGATDIMLEDSSPNFLVLDAMGAEKAHFVGSEQTSVSVVYEFAGTKFTYKREGDIEAITTPGPIKDRVVVKVKMSDQPAVPISLRYQFYKPTTNGSEFFWSHFKWSDCSKTCGEGIQTHLYKCRRNDNKSEVVKDNCFALIKPEPLTRPCNLTACERYVWKVSNWTKCSSLCNGGSQNRTVECRGVLVDRQVNSTLCTEERPEKQQICNDQPCPAEWIVGNWTQCSRTCGNSVQQRLVECRNILGAVSLNCPRDARPPQMRICRKVPCEGELLANMSCSFEEGFCEWRNVRASRLDQFDWALLSGSTPSQKTGPTNDHTLGTSRGFYVYIEASHPQRRNDRARLISPVVRARSVCLNFWYHMYGDKMGWLRVMYRLLRGRDRRIWHKTGNQKNEWHNERLTINSYLPYQIIFEGIRGNGFSSDIALDDIKISSGGCSPKSPESRFQCTSDKSRYCKAAIRLNWCSSSRWSKMCCKTCERVTLGGS
ncbi:unnamed protein product [Porites lobata]|uniref:Uncharacterized protein n=1 Tax=Porites lobata TaxID=104759 RepID=A0ABN8MYI5_9CNID|nr:unnamed protein product [Porites lobata]